MSIRPKGKHLLQNQVEKVSNLIGTNIVPPSKVETIYDESVSDLKGNYSKRYQLLLSALRRSASLNEEKEKTMIEALNNLDIYISNHIDNDKTRTLRKQQFLCFQKLRDFLEKGETEGYFKLPTGYGKTVLFTEFVEAIGLKPLIVVPKLGLAEQTEEKFETFAPNLDIGLINGKLKEYGKKVTIITYDSFVSEIKKGKLNPKDYDCLILDEAHRCLTPPRIETVKKFDHAIQVGFTATPKFNENKKVSNLLKTEIHSISLNKAIRDGDLCSVKCMLAKTKVDLRNVEIKNGQYNEQQLLKAINIKSRNKAAVDLYKKYFNGQIFLANCLNIAHAEEVAKEFNEAGISAACISSETPIEDKDGQKGQETLKREHREGKIKVLCQADLLTEGYDEPRVSGCINLAPTRSLVVAEQRGGRVLRLDPDNQVKFATVIDFVDEENTEDGKGSIFFAQILGEAEVISAVEQVSTTEKKPGEEVEKTEEAMNIQGLEVITDTEEIMRVTNARTPHQDYDDIPVEEPPEKWKDLSNLAHLFQTNIDVLLKTIKENFSFEMTDKFKTIRTAKTQKTGITYIHPDLQEQIIIYWINKNPDQFVYFENLAEELELELNELMAEVNKRKLLVAPTSNGIITFFDGRGQQRFVLHKDNETTKTLRSAHIFGSKWIRETVLIETLGVSKEYLETFIDAKKAQYSNKRLFVRKTLGNELEYIISPKVVEIITNEIKAKYPPEGWVAGRELFERIFDFPDDVLYKKIIRECVIDDTEKRQCLTNSHNNHPSLSKSKWEEDLYLSPKAAEIFPEKCKVVEAWPTDKSLVSELQINHSKLFYVLDEQVLKENPSIFGTYFVYFSGANTKGLASVGKYKVNPVLLPLIKEKIEKLNIGEWMELDVLYKDLKISKKSLLTIVKKIFAEKEDLFRKFNPRKGERITFILPEAVQQIRQEIAEIKKNKKASELAQELSIPDPLLREIINHYASIFPLFVVEFADSDFSQVYIAPEIEEKIRATINIPKDWQNAQFLASSLSIDPKILPGKLATLKGKFPNEYRKYWNPTSLQLEEFYGENIILALKTEAEAKLDQFKDWPSVEEIATKYGRDISVISLIITNLNLKLGRDITVKTSDAAAIIVRVNPAYIVKIQERIPPPNEDWMTPLDLAKDLGQPLANIQREANKSPGLQETFYNNKPGKREIYLHPDLVIKISEAF